jgi:hypothetical protein
MEKIPTSNNDKGNETVNLYESDKTEKDDGNAQDNGSNDDSADLPLLSVEMICSWRLHRELKSRKDEDEYLYAKRCK